MRCRFVGTYSEILDTPYKLTRFGQLVEIPDDLLRSIAGRIPLLPAEDVEKVITPEELKLYADPRTHAKAPKEFMERVTRVRMLVQGLPGKLLAAAAPVVAAVPEEIEELKGD